MKLPNGFGQIIKLKGKRRRPFAVRVSMPVEYRNGRYIKPQKYLGYFEKRTEALKFLSDYNAGIKLPAAPLISSTPLFCELWDMYLEYRQSIKGGLSPSNLQGYMAGYKNLSSLHHLKFINIRPDDLQKAISERKHMSESSVRYMMIVLHGMYKYAIRQEIIDKDYSMMITPEYTRSDESKHKAFTEDEIALLWDNHSYTALTMIYTGIRATELLTIESIDIDARYMIGGSKTAAGRNRIIPIHERIVPFVKDCINPGIKTFNTFYNRIWIPEMTRLNLDHKPHDTRHTCASLMEKYNVPLLHRKLILGHAVKDFTENVYTHISTEVLIDDINLIP